tara:strand:+ start:211 stop:387 length:177 start_codon:yes stop_codon:yes gene_type:complete
MSRSKVSGFKIRPPKAGFGYVTNLDLKTLNAYSAEFFQIMAINPINPKAAEIKPSRHA